MPVGDAFTQRQADQIRHALANARTAGPEPVADLDPREIGNLEMAHFDHGRHVVLPSASQNELADGKRSFGRQAAGRIFCERRRRTRLLALVRPALTLKPPWRA